MPLETQNPAISPKEVHVELKLLLQSPHFNRSEKLQRFLRFVCDTTLQGAGSEINEHLIGIEVFRRGHDYNPSEDAIVRRHAHALRQKLQDYYATEGAERTLRIEMPVGRYVPVFRRREELAAEIAAPPVRAPAPLADRVWPRRWWFVLTAAGCFGLGWLAASLGPVAPPQRSAAMREIWGPWIGKETALCFSNPVSAMVRQWANPVASDALAHSVQLLPGQELVFREKFALPKSGGIYLQPTIAQTMMGEASAATQIASLFARIGVPLRTMESRFLSWENLRRENHILLGGDEENHWVDLILDKYPFRLANPTDSTSRSIINTAPKAGEPRAYNVVGTEEVREEYALVSMVPGVAPNQESLIICGLNSPATPLATDYLTTESGRVQLVKMLREAAPKHAGVWHFQTVIKVDVRDKVPTRATIVALRVL